MTEIPKRPLTSFYPLLIAACGIFAYLNSFAGVFLFDDLPWIVENSRIRDLWPPREVIGGTHRPLLFYSLAANYALSGLATWSYHAFNLLVHLLAAMVLYGLVRRTLSLPLLKQRYDHTAAELALAIAVLWVVHPLQTQSVTYIIQRSESAMGLFYLLSLYCALRGMHSPLPRRFFAAAALANVLSLGFKEVMITAPLAILLFDRTFISGSFVAGLRRHRDLYIGLATPGLIAAVFLLSTNASQFFTLFKGDLQSASSLDYFLSQMAVFLHYLKLCFLPYPLIFDYGQPLVQDWSATLPSLLTVGLLASAAGWTLRRHPPLGFPGTCFFLILLPTSSIVPLQDLMVEHRMYLPLATVICMIVLAGYHLLDRFALRSRAALVLGGAVALALGFMTHQRNADYHSEFALWSEVIAHRPDNPRGYYNLGLEFHLSMRAHLEQPILYHAQDDAAADTHVRFGMSLLGQGLYADAATYLTQTLKSESDAPHIRNCLGMSLYMQDQISQAAEQYQQALALRPDYADAHNNLAICLQAQGDIDRALAHFKEALRRQPDIAEMHYNLGTLFASQGDSTAAQSHFQRALHLKPDFVEAQNNLGSLFLTLDRFSEAQIHFRQVLLRRPDYAITHLNIGLAQLRQSDYATAVNHLRQALESDRHSAATHIVLGIALHAQAAPYLGREAHMRAKIQQAVDHFQQAMQISPDLVDGHNNLGNSLLAQGKIDAAIGHYRTAVHLDSGIAEVHHNLGKALFLQRNMKEAIAHLRQASKLKPHHEAARVNLQKALALQAE